VGILVFCEESVEGVEFLEGLMVEFAVLLNEDVKDVEMCLKRNFEECRAEWSD
jgi:hypothetical protein